jgi:hypothetical protein
MILPSRIDIQIVNAAGERHLLGNVLFGLKIFTSNKSWHNYSLFKSDVDGHVVLTAQDIIANTELKWDKNIQAPTPTKFELYVWKGSDAASLIESVKLLLEHYEDKAAVEQDLKRHGITSENMASALLVVAKQAVEDKKLYSYIKDAVNSLVRINTEKVKGIWTDDVPKFYSFVIQ